jgi:hypothetical protein
MTKAQEAGSQGLKQLTHPGGELMKIEDMAIVILEGRLQDSSTRPRG